MRKLLVSLSVLVVFALGLAGAFLAFSSGAGAEGLVDGTFTGSVGTSGMPNAYEITLNTPSSVAPGTYELDITDYATIHNFDLCKGASCTGANSVDKTSISGTGSVMWTVALTPGTYTYQCDAHPELQGQFTVSGGTTSTTTTTTPPPLNASISKITPARKVVTVNAKANQTANFKAWLLKGSTQLATATTRGMTVQLKLKPVKALKPGTYVVQLRVFTSATTFKVIRKKITVM
jgi:hypothetical protein